MPLAIEPLDDLPATQAGAVEPDDPADGLLLGLVLDEPHAVRGEVVAERDLVAHALTVALLVGQGRGGPLADEVTFELGQGRDRREEEPPHPVRGVDLLGDAYEVGPGLAKLVGDVDRVSGGAGQAGERVDDEDPVARASGPDRMIDFETFPDGSTPASCERIGFQYLNAFGLIFVMSDNTLPRAAQVGGQVFQAFQGPRRENHECGVDMATERDMPALGEPVGCTFLTDDDCIVAPNPKTLRVVYLLRPAKQACGDLLDIDAAEQWTIRALDEQNVVRGQVVISAGDPDTGDGVASAWRFAFDSPVIWNLEFEFTGAGNSVGIAFDNFYPHGNCIGDINGDGEIGFDDLLLILSDWACTSS